MKIFLASSTTARERGLTDVIILALRAELGDQAEILPWWEKFEPGSYTLVALFDAAHEVDAAICVFAADDQREFNRRRDAVTRDNVVLEFGMFVASLGPERAVVISEQDVAIPSDMFGVTLAGMFKSHGPEQEASLRQIIKKVAARFKTLKRLERSGQINDSGIGLQKTLLASDQRLRGLTADVEAFATDGTGSSDLPFTLDASSCINAYVEGLSGVERRFWATSSFNTKFWFGVNPRPALANLEMGKRVKAAGGDARRLFFLSQCPQDEVEAQKQLRVFWRQMNQDVRLRAANAEFSALKRNVVDQLAAGLLVRVVFDDANAVTELPQEMRASLGPDTNGIAMCIYEDRRVDIFDTGLAGRLYRVDCYTRAMESFDAILSAAEHYFMQLWERGIPMLEFIDMAEAGHRAAAVKIDYEPHWLAIYEFGLEDDDKRLKTLELGRVAEIIRREGKWGNVKRLLDVGTCTGRYLSDLRDSVEPAGELLGIDSDIDCVRFARSRLGNALSTNPIAAVQHLDFTSGATRIHGHFDVITCTLGTISHFGIDRQIRSADCWSDGLQKALTYLESLLDAEGLLFIGSWSDEALEHRDLLGIYRRWDRDRLVRWTPTADELKERLEAVGLHIVEVVKLDPRLDLWVCGKGASVSAAFSVATTGA